MGETVIFGQPPHCRPATAPVYVRLTRANAGAFAGSAAATSTGTITQNVAVIGTVTAEVVAPPTITSFTSTSGGPGTIGTITGIDLTGATAVRIGTFNVPVFTEVNAMTISLMVPGGTGSVSGLISATTPGGIANSTATFNLVSATLAANALSVLTVFPNPATDRLTVTLPTAASATVALRDLAGRLVYWPRPR